MCRAACIVYGVEVCAQAQKREKLSSQKDVQGLTLSILDAPLERTALTVFLLQMKNPDDVERLLCCSPALPMYFFSFSSNCIRVQFQKRSNNSNIVESLLKGCYLRCNLEFGYSQLCWT